MIALNDLIDNIERYEQAYNLMGLNENLNSIVDLENKRKVVQLEAEKMRADCNALCSKMADVRKKNEDTEPSLTEILELNKQISKLSRELDSYEKRINLKLDRLHNLPDELNTLNLQIETKNNQSNFTEFTSFLKSFMQSSHSLKSLAGYIKKFKNRVFTEDELPKCIFLRNGIMLLVPDYKTNETMNKLLDYFKEKCMNIIQLSVKYLKKSSSAEYQIQLNNHRHIKVRLKREYFSRKYKIKYKNKELDMTKFVNQINIMYL